MSDNPLNKPLFSIADMQYLMARLRDPEAGCPWDLEQDYRSITPSTIEEAYEVVDAIDRQDHQALKEELGDLLFQVIFYCQLASEEKNESHRFTFEDIVSTLVEKLLRRHPHVFPDGTLQSSFKDMGLGDTETQIKNSQNVKAQWEQIKQQERSEKGEQGLFDDIPAALPALNRAGKLQKRAANVGFDWDDYAPVIDKLQEEITELKEAVAKQDQDNIHEEIGDILFTCVNLSRKLKVNSESALRGTNYKFQQRISYIEAALSKQDLTMTEASLEVMDDLWERAKSDAND